MPAIKKFISLVLILLPVFVWAESLPTSDQWTVYGSAILSPGSSGQWDDGGVWMGYMVKEGSTYYLYYVGFDGYDAQGSEAHKAIGLATSSSPTGPFTRYEENPIISWNPNPSHENEAEEGAEYPCIVIDNGTWYMYWTANTVTGSQTVSAAIRLSTSTDGYTWGSSEEILNHNDVTESPSEDEVISLGILKINGQTDSCSGSWVLWFNANVWGAPATNYRTGIALGNSYNNLTVCDSPILTQNPAIGGDVYYHAADSKITLLHDVRGGGWTYNTTYVRECPLNDLDDGYSLITSFNTTNYRIQTNLIKDTSYNLWRMYYTEIVNNPDDIRMRSAPFGKVIKGVTISGGQIH